jgi:dihydrofolate reductase
MNLQTLDSKNVNARNLKSKEETPMRKVISFTHMSLDGFIAGPKGEMDWIVYDDEVANNAGELCRQADSALYGRVTYQMMESYWPMVPADPGSSAHERHHAAWIENVHKIVFSTSMDTVTWNNTTLIQENIGEELMKFKAQPGGNMLIFGSPRLTHSLARLGLIDQYRVNVNPVAIGQGMPLFESNQERVKLNLVESKRFSCGVLGLLYEVVR